MFQTVKPRARYAHGIWMIQGSGVITFGPTLDDAVRLWRGCLMELAGV